MYTNAGSVTQLAYRVIEELEAQCLTPEETLEFLLNEGNFKNLSALLKETMVKAGICNETDPQSRFANELYSRLIEQDAECGKTAKRSDAAVKRWISGYTKSIRYRQDAIEICFALGLDAEQTIDFLRKAGFNGLNVRDAEDAAYLYCLLNHRPLSAAKNIIEKYSRSAEPAESGDQPQTVHSGHTTLVLKDRILGSWEDDNAFLNTFLIPNKSRFLGFSFRATKAYYVLKNNLFITVLADILYDEEHLETERMNYDKGTEAVESDPDIGQKEIPVTLAVHSAFEKLDSSSVLFPIGQTLSEHTATTREALIKVRDLTANRSTDIAADIEVQKEISLFLSDVIKTEGLLKAVVSSIRSQGGRIRRYRDSDLRDTVMKEFPDDHTFANFENDPSVIYHGAATRKAIILMYFLQYSYELPLYLDDLEYISKTFDDLAYTLDLKDNGSGFEKFRQLGLEEFISSLNNILEYCQLPQLYPANQFDWLILRSIRAIEDSDTSEEGESSLAFFNKVLSFSFGDDPGDPEK